MVILPPPVTVCVNVPPGATLTVFTVVVSLRLLNANPEKSEPGATVPPPVNRDLKVKF